MDEPRPNPPRRNMFAIWRWPKWGWFVIVSVMLVAYPLSFAPMVRLQQRVDLSNRNERAHKMYRTFYGPVIKLIINVDAVRVAYEAELDAVIWLESWTLPERNPPHAPGI